MGGDHKCPVCSATFTRPQHVARHMRSHTGDRPYKCQHCGDQFARSDLLSRHVNKCHANEKPLPSAGNSRRKGSASATRATTSKQACDQCVQSSLPCDGCNPCAKCVQRKCRCTFVKFHRQTAPIGPGHNPRPHAGSTAAGSLPNLSHLTHLPHPVQFPPQQGSNIYASRVPLYSQSAHGGPDDFSLGPPPGTSLADPHHGHGGVTSSGLYAHNFTFPPVYPGAPVPSADSGAGIGMGVDTSDYASKYRAQQAELLRRGSLPSYGSTSGLAGGAGGAPWLGGWHTSEPESSSTSSSYSSSSALHDLADKELDVAIARQMLVANAGEHHHVYGYGQHLPRARRASQDYSDGDTSGHSMPSSATSSNVHLPLDTAAFRDSQTGAYLSHHLNGRGSAHPPADSSSSSSNPSQSRPGTSQGEGGFSSAFGLMSLDDPNVLAGLSTDGAPFFSMMDMEGNGDPNATPMPSKHDGGGAVQQQSQHQASHGTHHVRPSTGHGHPHGSHGGGPPVQTPGTREAETKELREFWKQYMRTPLSGPGPGVLAGSPHHHPSGGQVQSSGGDVSMLSPGLHGPGGPLAGGYRRQRVASLPSVKTPTAVEDEERFLYAQGYTNGRYGASNSNPGTSQALPQGHPSQQQNQQGDSSMRTTLHGNVDDLRSYEAAVLARKAPTTLNLVPRIRKSKGNVTPVGGPSNAAPGQVGGSTLNASPTVPVSHLSSIQEHMDSKHAHGQQQQHVTFAPGTNPDSSLASAFGIAGMTSAHSPASTSSSYSRESSVDDHQFSQSGKSLSMRRPSFKRLPSQTLESAHAKRALLTRDSDEEDDADREYSGSSGGDSHSGESREGSAGGLGRYVLHEQVVEDVDEDEDRVPEGQDERRGTNGAPSMVYAQGMGGFGHEGYVEKRRRMSAPTTKSPTSLTFTGAGQM